MIFRLEQLHVSPFHSSNISSGQILSCEYTVHPLWLADNNDGTELWPENLPKQSSQDEMELVQGIYLIHFFENTKLIFDIRFRFEFQMKL